ncbi:hypothetical protein D3C78_1735070 [compost metagenome]
MGGNPQVCTAQWGGGGFQAIGVDVGEGEVAPLGRQLLGQGAADTRTRPCNDRDLPCKRLHLHSFLVCLASVRRAGVRELRHRYPAQQAMARQGWARGVVGRAAAR